MSLRINKRNFRDFLRPRVNGELVSTGYIPRDYKAHPRGSYSSASITDITLIPREEWSERIKELKANKAQISDVRRRMLNGQPMPSLDQNSRGYCWAHSVVHCVMLKRGMSNMPYEALSAFSVACKIKNFKDQGGWGAQALEFIEKNGIMPQKLWPQKSMSKSHDTRENWEVAKDYRVTESWADLAESVYDRNLTFDQVGSLLLSGTPVVLEYNWWSHSVCGMDLEELNPRLSLNDEDRWGVKILNSWSDSWGDLGEGILEGEKSVPDGAVAPSTVMGV